MMEKCSQHRHDNADLRIIVICRDGTVKFADFYSSLMNYLPQDMYRIYIPLAGIRVKI